MASPPNTTGLNLSQKRPSLALPSNPNPKRRKPSSGPSQLRQTSFPPPESSAVISTPASLSATTPRPFSRSPSVESSIAGTAATSLVNGVGGRKKRKRKGDGAADDSRSMTGTSVRGGKAGSAAEAEADDDEDMGEGDVEVNLEGDGKVMDDAAAKQERERLALLLSNLDDDQKARHAIWRAVKLKKEIVRRITNQTLSQSVPQSVILTINGYTKTFIGEIIDRARQVQLEWHQAGAQTPYPKRLLNSIKPPQPPPPPPPPYPHSHVVQSLSQQHSPLSRSVPSPYVDPTTTPTQSQESRATTSTATPTPTSTPTSGNPNPAKPEPEPEPTCVEIMNGELGPLTPDHLREALRRYKKDREGSSTGFLGLSLEGRENSAARMGGKKLFR